MTKTEGKLEEEFQQYAIKRGALAKKFEIKSENFWPDRIVFVDSTHYFFVELKKPHTGRLSKGQKEHHQRLKVKYGIKVYIINNIEDFKTLPWRS